MDNLPSFFNDDFLGIKLTSESDLALLPDAGFDYEDIKAQFDPQVPFYEKTDYIVSAASGVLTALLDVFLVKNMSLEDAHNWGSDRVNEFVIEAARFTGYKGKDLKGAVSHLEKYHIPGDAATSEFGGGLQHHLRDFSHHPSIVGLFFSLLTQFTGNVYGTDKSGAFKWEPVPDDMFIGGNTAEKLMFGTIKWMFHLISDMAGSSGSIGKRTGGTGIPGPLLSFMKEMSASPFFQIFKNENNDSVFSVWLSKLFNGTATGDGVRFDLRTELGLLYNQMKHSLPVIANEIIVRSYYLVSRFCVELSDKNIKSISQLNLVDINRIIPIKKRRLSRMLTISSGTFFAITTSVTVAKGIATENYAGIFINLNYVGIARFAIAFVGDFQYIKEDSQALFEEMKERQSARDKFFAEENIGVSYFVLSEKQACFLDSLKYQKIEYDISKSSVKDAEIKEKWKSQWLEKITEINEYDLITDEPRLYLDIRDEVKRTGDKFWLYLVAINLTGFKNYYPFGDDQSDDKKYKMLMFNSNYEQDCFSILQNIVDRDEYKKISILLNKNEDIVSGVSKNIVSGVATTMAFTALAGGVSVLTVPMTLALSSSSILLNGMLLTNENAVVTGGGALMRLLGLGSVSSSILKFLSSEGNILSECVCILTYCDILKAEKDNGTENIKDICNFLENSKEEFEADLAQMKASKSKDKDNKLIRASEQSLKYINRTIKEIKKKM